MGTHLARLLLAGLAAAALALAGVRIARHFHHQHVLRTGDHLAPFQVSSIDGPVQTFAPARRETVINVFATWCGPCRSETPGFASAASALLARGVDVVGIDQEEGGAAVAAFARTFALPYRVYIDTTGVTHDLLGARMIPTTIIVNRAGVIVWEHAGPLTRAQLLAAISQTESST